MNLINLNIHFRHSNLGAYSLDFISMQYCGELLFSHVLGKMLLLWVRLKTLKIVKITNSCTYDINLFNIFKCLRWIRELSINIFSIPTLI